MAEISAPSITLVDLFGVSLHLDAPAEFVDTLAGLMPGWSLRHRSDFDPSAPEPEAVGYRAEARMHGPSLLGYEVRRSDHSLVGRSPQLEKIAQTLASELHFEVACRTEAFVFVHAGAVGWNDKAILLPGRSMSGKSTLVVELVRQGATYYSDEYAVFDDAGMVHPYCRPLGLREADGTTSHVSPYTLGGGVGGPPLAVGLIAALQYDSDGSWDVENRSSSAAALSIIDNTVKARDDAQRTLSIAALAAGSSRAIAGSRGEAAEAASALLSLVSTTDPHHDSPAE